MIGRSKLRKITTDKVLKLKMEPAVIRFEDINMRGSAQMRKLENKKRGSAFEKLPLQRVARKPD